MSGYLAWLIVPIAVLMIALLASEWYLARRRRDDQPELSVGRSYRWRTKLMGKASGRLRPERLLEPLATGRLHPSSYSYGGQQE